MTERQILLSTAYFGPIEYYAYLAKSKKVTIESHEHYIKQTWRNRCAILTANGLQSLTIPVIKVHGNHTKICDIEISNAEKWQMIHWRAIVAAYNHSPYFLYYQDELELFFKTKFDNLFEFNNRILETILALLDFDRKIVFSEDYIEQEKANCFDLRNTFSPKKETILHFDPYIQVFADRFGFIPNLSILDLLFNLGPEASVYLQNVEL